jgi:hypothetical protein
LSNKYYKWKRRTIERLLVDSASYPRDQMIAKIQWFIIDQCNIKSKHRKVVLADILNIIYNEENNTSNKKRSWFFKIFSKSN